MPSLKQFSAALTGAGEEKMHSIVKSGSINVVDCLHNILTEFRDTVTKKINPKHKKDEPVLLSLPLGEGGEMVPYPGKINMHPANMLEDYASESNFKQNIPGKKKKKKKGEGAKRTLSQTAWNGITLDDGKNWDCDPVYIQSPPEYQVQALAIDEYASKEDPLSAALTEAGAEAGVLELASSVRVLNGVIEITLGEGDKDSDDDDTDDDDSDGDSGDKRDVRHNYWDRCRSVYITLSDMTAHAEASRAMPSYTPSSFTICEGRFTFNQEMYCWIDNLADNSIKRKRSSHSKKSSPSPNKKVSVLI
jgi:hypothetical protein